MVILGRGSDSVLPETRVIVDESFGYDKSGQTNINNGPKNKEEPLPEILKKDISHLPMDIYAILGDDTHKIVCILNKFANRLVLFTNNKYFYYSGHSLKRNGVIRVGAEHSGISSHETVIRDFIVGLDERVCNGDERVECFCEVLSDESKDSLELGLTVERYQSATFTLTPWVDTSTRDKLLKEWLGFCHSDLRSELQEFPEFSYIKSI